MKRVFSIILSFILIFNFVFISFSYADTIEELRDVEISTGRIDGIEGLGTSSGDVGDIEHDEDDQAGYEPSGLFATIIGWILDFVTGLINTPLAFLIVTIPTIDGMIFNKQPFFRLSFFDAQPEGLASSLQGAISAVYNALRYLVVAAYIVILVYLAIRMMFSSIGRQKAHYKELFKHWLVGLLLLFSFHHIMGFIIWLSNTFVEILSEIATGLLPVDGLQLNNLLRTFIPKLQEFPITMFMLSRFEGGNGLSRLLSVLTPLTFTIFSILLIISTFSIVVTYFKRLFTIAILILLFPIVALSYVFDKIGDRKAQTLSIWLKEFVVNVAIQPIHALILTFIALLYSTGIPENTTEQIVGNNLFGAHLLGAIMCLVSLRLIPMGEELLKKLFQINSSMGPGSDGIAGSMAKAGMAYRGFKDMTSKTLGHGKNLMTMGKIMHGQDGLKSAYKEASAAKKAAQEGLHGRARMNAGKEAMTKSLANNQAYKNLQKQLKEQTGYSKPSDLLKHSGAASLAGLGGAASALTSAQTGKFASEALAKASAAIALTDGISKSVDSTKELIWGKPKNAEDVTKLKNLLEKPSEINGAQLGQLALTLNMPRGMVAEKLKNNPDELKGELTKMERFMKFTGSVGGTLEKAQEQTSYAVQAKRIKDGKDPVTGELINKEDYEVIQTNKETMLRSKDSGEMFYVPGVKGNSKLEDGETAVYSSTTSAPEVQSNITVRDNLISSKSNADFNKAWDIINDPSVSKGSYEYKTAEKQVDAIIKEEISEQKSTLRNYEAAEYAYNQVFSSFDPVIANAPTPTPANPTPTPANPTPAPANPTPAPANPTPAPANPSQSTTDSSSFSTSFSNDSSQPTGPQSVMFYTGPQVEYFSFGSAGEPEELKALSKGTMLRVQITEEGKCRIPKYPTIGSLENYTTYGTNMMFTIFKEDEEKWQIL